MNSIKKPSDAASVVGPENSKTEEPGSREGRDAFLERCAVDLARVRVLIQSNAPNALEELRRLAHGISEAAAVVGLAELSQEANALKHALAGDGDVADTEPKEVLTRLERVVEAA